MEEPLPPVTLPGFELSNRLTFLCSLHIWETYPYLLQNQDSLVPPLLHESLLFCVFFPLEAEGVISRLFALLTKVLDGKIDLPNNATLTASGGVQWSILLKVLSSLMQISNKTVDVPSQTNFWSYLVEPSLGKPSLKSVVSSASYMNVSLQLALRLVIHFGNATVLRVEVKKRKQQDRRPKQEEKEKKQQTPIVVREGPHRGTKSKYKMTFRPEIIELLDTLAASSDVSVAYTALTTMVS